MAFVPPDQVKRMPAFEPVYLKIVFINGQDAALAHLVRQPDQRHIGEIDILIRVFLDVDGQIRVTADRNIRNRQPSMCDPIQQCGFARCIQKKAGFHDNRHYCLQRQPVLPQVVQRRLMQSITADVQRDQKASVNE